MLCSRTVDCIIYFHILLWLLGVNIKCCKLLEDRVYTMCIFYPQRNLHTKVPQMVTEKKKKKRLNAGFIALEKIQWKEVGGKI